MKIETAFFFVVAVALSAGCGMHRILTDSGIDAKHDAAGNATLLDTARNWDSFVELTDISIDHESEGSTHWGKFTNANDAWINSIHHIQHAQEHPEKYVDYIVEQRRAAHLPELIGYP